MLKLLGSSEAQAATEAQAIMKLETSLAKVSLDITSQRDPHNIYHLMPNGGLQSLTPGFNWEHFYPATGSPAFSEINVAEPEFFKGMNQVIADTDLATIKSYLRWQLVTSLPGTVLPKALDEERFDFGGRKLAGVPEQEPRWKRCVASTDGALGEALGKAYVEQQFPASSKATTLQMIHDIEAAVDRDKQRNLISVAREYLRHLAPSCQWRFDVVSVYYEGQSRQPQFEVFRSAFPVA